MEKQQQKRASREREEREINRPTVRRDKMCPFCLCQDEGREVGNLT